MAETWEDRFKRAVATHAGVPLDIPLADIEVTTRGEDGYAYSEYTFEDPNIRIDVQWSAFGKVRQYRVIDGPSAIAELIQSFLPPAVV